MFFQRNFSKELLNTLYRYAYSLCQDADLAFDLVQSCCEKVLSHKKPIVNLKKYSMRVVRNTYIDHYRRNKLELIVDSELEDVYHLGGDQILYDLENHMIDKQHSALLLNDMHDYEQELLFLWAVEGFTITEISRLLDIPRGTILARLARLKKRLVKKFPRFSKDVN